MTHTQDWTPPEEPYHEEESFHPTLHPHHPQPSHQPYCAILAFVLILSIVLTIKAFSESQYEKIGKLYKNQIMKPQLIDFWKRTQQQLEEQQKEKGQKILDKGEHSITRQQLGRSSWQLLHMMTGSFPDEIDEVLAQKFNTFFILFGQMYPCKLCANHFMQHLREIGPFKGSKKKQLMNYLCDFHNQVNESLGKPIHSCQNVYEEWNTCGCASS